MTDHMTLTSVVTSTALADIAPGGWDLPIEEHVPLNTLHSVWAHGVHSSVIEQVSSNDLMHATVYVGGKHIRCVEITLGFILTKSQCLWAK